jgi:hypothetical protein
MELLIALGLVLIALVAFDVAALRFGVDSRETIGDDHGFAVTPRWQ